MSNEFSTFKNNISLVIAIPTLNSENTLRITMNSILNQEKSGIDIKVVLLDSGEVMVCGENSFGQLGINTSGFGNWKETLVSMDSSGNYDKTNALAISCGNDYTAILLSSGEVMTCGYNVFGQLGDGHFFDQSTLVPMIKSGNYDNTNAMHRRECCYSNQLKILLS